MGPGGGASTTTAGGPPATGADSGSGAGSGAGSGSGSGKTYDGTTVQTRWGPVRVRITVDGGKVTDVTAVTYPNGNRRDQEINAYALPQLRTEVLQAQSADIDTVSGATVTSDGYKESLQAALDAAHLG
jgi:uncharacterized protein with FMN-binding domain